MQKSQKDLGTRSVLWAGRPQIRFLAILFGILLIQLRPAFAVSYEYIGRLLPPGTGSTLAGHPIVFEFSAYNILPPDLTFDRDRELPPASNVPAINWSVSIGQYQAAGVGTPEFFQFSTESSGTITGWFFLVTPVTTDGKNQINVIAGTEFFELILGP